MPRKPNLNMDEVEAQAREMAEAVHHIFEAEGWTWHFSEKITRIPTVDEITETYLDNLKAALKWWTKSGKIIETVTSGRLRVAVHGGEHVGFINFMLEIGTYWRLE